MSGRVAATCLFIFLPTSALHAADLTLAWDANSESDIAGYKVHYGSQSGAYTTVVDVGLKVSCVIAGLQDGSRYYFAVQAYSTSALHGQLSLEIEAITPVPTPTVGRGLVAAYGFDGSGTTASDSSGRAHHGTISGATSTAGRFGRALRFDGIDDWVTVAAADALNVRDAMTIEAWVYPTAAGGWRTIAFKEAPTEVWRHTYGLYSTFGSEGPGGHALLAGYANVHDPAALPLDRWSHIATTYDGVAVRFFLNGVERAKTLASGPIAASSGALRIGGNAMWGDFFQGRIDELRLYDRALSAAEINTDMATPVTGWLAAAYGFDDARGLLVKDDSGRSQHGQISGASWAAGKFGTGLRFDGIDDVVTIADDAWLDLTTSMTLEAWVYPTALGGWRTLLLKEFDNWYAYGLYADGASGAAVHAQLSTDASAPARRTLPLNTWTHLAATFDGTTLRLFIDGQLAASSPSLTGSIRTSAGALRIGGNSLWGEYFKGTIDEVRIYYRALTEAEIQKDMVTPVGGGLAAEYSFDDGSGSTLQDDSGRGLTGTISGATWTDAGRFGGALRFDGIDDCVTVPDSILLDVSTQMTLEAWVYPTALGGWRTVMLKEFGSWYAYGLYADGASGATTHAYLSTDASAPAGRPVPLHTWTHLAATFDGTRLRLFINGEFVSESLPLSGEIQTSEDALRIGGNSIWGEYFAGLIDEVRVYSRALSAAEIAADMHRPIR